MTCPRSYYGKAGRLRNLHDLLQDFASPLQRTDAQISDLIAAGNNSSDFPLFPGVTNNANNNRSGPRPLPWKVLLSTDALPEKVTLPQWKDGQFLIYAAKGSAPRKWSRTALISQPMNQQGGLVTSGIFNTEKPIVFPAKAGEAYMLNIPLRKPSQFQLQVQNAAASGIFKPVALYAGVHN